MAGAAFGLLGEVTAERDIRIRAGGEVIASVSLDEVRAAWAGQTGSSAHERAASEGLRHHRVSASTPTRSSPLPSSSPAARPDAFTSRTSSRSRACSRGFASSRFPEGSRSVITWARARCLQLFSAGTWGRHLPASWPPAAGGRDLQRLPGPREDGRPAESLRDDQPGGVSHPQRLRQVRGPVGEGQVRARIAVRLDARASGDGPAGTARRGKIRHVVSRAPH